MALGVGVLGTGLPNNPCDPFPKRFVCVSFVRSQQQKIQGQNSVLQGGDHFKKQNYAEGRNFLCADQEVLDITE